MHGTCTALCPDELRGATGRLTVVCQDFGKVGKPEQERFVCALAAEVCGVATREEYVAR